MNVQELQTIVHHKLPIKIIVYRNDCYLMIRHTQHGAGMQESGIAPDSGVSFMDYRKLAHAIGMRACDVKSWEEFNRALPQLFTTHEPMLIQYWMQHDQPLVPKLDPVRNDDGTVSSPRFDQMSPLTENGYAF